MILESPPKQTQEFEVHGETQTFVLERAITTDFGLVRAAKGDRHGNLVFNQSARNFNPLCAMAGRVTVAGFTPQRRQRDFLTSITLVMGQKQQLIWDLPAADTLLVNQAIHAIPDSDSRARLAEPTALPERAPLLNEPVSTLPPAGGMRWERAGAARRAPWGTRAATRSRGNTATAADCGTVRAWRWDWASRSGSRHGSGTARRPTPIGWCRTLRGWACRRNWAC